MRRSFQLVTGAMTVALSTLTVVLPADASSTCVSVGTPGNYSLYSGGAAAIGGGAGLAVTSGGPVAFGGSTALDDATLANAAGASASQLTFISGGGGSATGATLTEGSGEYVGSLSGSISTPGGGTIKAVSASALPFSFTTVSSALQSTASSLASQSPAGTVGTITPSGSTLTLLGASSGVNYFALSSSLLSGITTITVNLSGGGVGVVNLGSVTSLNNKTITVAAGTSATNVLFNTTGSLTLNSDTFNASALASGAISVDGDTLGGSLFAAGSLTVYNTMQSYALFNGCGPGFSVAETPFAPFLPIVAVGVIGLGMTWRHRRQLNIPSGN